MLTVYWIATLVGWAFVLFFLFSGGEIDADFEVDSGLDADVDGDLDAGGGGALSAILSFLSLRALAFMAAFFGLAGLLLTWIDTGTVLTVFLAVGIGFFAMWLNRTLLRYLARTSSDSRIRDRYIEGSPASVTIPIRPGHRGRVVVEVRGQRLVFTAVPYGSRDDAVFDVGDDVVIVEIENGTAKIAALDVGT